MIHAKNAFTLLYLFLRNTCANLIGNIKWVKLKQLSLLHFLSGAMSIWGNWEDSKSIKSKEKAGHTLWSMELFYITKSLYMAFSIPEIFFIPEDLENTRNFQGWDLSLGAYKSLRENFDWYKIHEFFIQKFVL